MATEWDGGNTDNTGDKDQQQQQLSRRKTERRPSAVTTTMRKKGGHLGRAQMTLGQVDNVKEEGLMTTATVKSGNDDDDEGPDSVATKKRGRKQCGKE